MEKNVGGGALFRFETQLMTHRTFKMRKPFINLIYITHTHIYTHSHTWFNWKIRHRSGQSGQQIIRYYPIKTHKQR